MDRRFVIAAFVVAALLPQALAAQTTSPSSASKSSSSPRTTSHSNNGKNWQHHHRHQSPWSRNVIVTGVNAQDYLTPTSTPKPPAKNNVNTGGTVFKSIGN